MDAFFRAQVRVTAILLGNALSLRTNWPNAQLTATATDSPHVPDHLHGGLSFLSCASNSRTFQGLTQNVILLADNVDYG